MTAVTITQLQTRLLLELNKNSTDYGTPVISAIVAAIRYYEGKRFWFLEKNAPITLLISTSSIALPADFKSHIRFRLLKDGYYYGQAQGFDLITYDELKALFTNVTDTNTPTNCAIFGTTLYVDRVADQAYTIDVDYLKGDTAYPASGSDTSVWFDDGVELIRTKALAILYGSVLHDEERASYYQNETNDWLTTLTARHNTRQYSNRLA